MNHEGHDVKIWISRGAGGCCDCGDPEAWKVPLECGIHSLQTTADISENTSATANQRQLEPLSSVPPNIFHSVKETITVVLDYILETFAASPEDVVSVGTVESIQQDCIDSHESLGLPVNQKNQKYACILWNDEKHSFDEVISTVMKALNCSKEEAAYAAECVDLYGRHIIKESANIAELVRIAEVISDINLAVTICSSEKTVREEIAGLLLDWLKELTGGRYKFFNNVNGGNCIIRDILCEVLSTDWALRPELAWLSIRYRRGRMPENEDDPFDHDETDADMDDEGDVEDMMFGDDVEEIDEEDILLDEDQIDDLFQRFGAEVEDEEDSDETFEDAEELPSISVQQNNETEAIDMDTDQPTQTTRPLFTSSTSNESLSRRRQSDVQPPHNEAGSSNLESQGRAAEVLKRRRLSASSQPKSSKTHKSRDILDMDWSLEAWLEYTEKLELEEKAITQQLGIPPESTATSTNDTLAETRLINANLKKEFKRKLRIDYLLLFDLRLWKTARISIKDLLIGTLISNFDYRPILGTRFARNYPDLVDAFFFKDREPENSVSTLSVQLLTVPTVASMLVKDYKFFGIVCSILENFFLTDHVHMLLPEEFQRAQVDCSSKAIGRHRYAYTIFDLRYVMNAEQVKAEISKNPVYLRQFLDMLFQFQEMDAIKRKADAHVEFESQSWVTAFNMTLQISKLCRLFAECFNSPAEVAVADASRNLCRSIYRVLKAISEWTHIIESHKNRDTVENISEDDESSPVQTTTPRTRFFFSVRESRDNKEARVKIAGVGEQSFHQISTPTAGTFSIVDYDITTKPVSFHHPFHWLLSELFENVSLLHQGILNELGWLGGFKQMVSDAFQSKDHDMFLLVLEYPIRTIAMLSQISCGVWVRNGYNIRNQV
jgi:E3 ubiquitin-protein ligase UBR1